ncbi:MAG: ankyrin repeat domain-containing protein [Planctomyces sp.]|nr:ankyrin repeat domain-containing protein [Planctomyces sp.]
MNLSPSLQNSSSAISKHAHRLFTVFFCLITFAVINGLTAADEKVDSKPSLHQRIGWVADRYFHNPKTIELCKAIEAKDLDRVRQAIADGADVNDRGTGNMNPLMWAFMDGKLEIFTHLLESGADPNVVYEDEFGLGPGFWKGMTIVSATAKSEFPGFFEAVMAHGGDPNTLDTRNNTTLYSIVIKSNSNQRYERIQLLIDLGANMEVVSTYGMTPVHDAVSFLGQYEIALLMLKHGADYRRYHEQHNTRLIHNVVMEEDSIRSALPGRADFYVRLVDWLERHGETRDEAKKDINQWKEWAVLSIDRQEFLYRRQAKERKQREEALRRQTLPESPQTPASQQN